MTGLRESKTLSIAIDRDPQAVYAFVTDPENLPKWAVTFCRSAVKSGEGWRIETSAGPMAVRFAPRNEFGVMDHYLTLPDGNEILVPMRVVPNNNGCEMIFTIFRQPGMSDENYAKDAGLVEQDLKNLKHILEKH
ncbi:MAG: SRPBCC family protein [Candidatus Omnitrophota bacterium]|nr:SRPBCC family protein [Candidatus Omnitrophota bacterium]MDZ4242649.1 SRPBCC family protein [Candidatus Omnitrophota bacterium]